MVGVAFLSHESFPVKARSDAKITRPLSLCRLFTTSCIPRVQPLQVFEEIGKREYPDIVRDRIIVDIGAVRILMLHPQLSLFG
jgi:hypothetical protein